MSSETIPDVHQQIRRAEAEVLAARRRLAELRRRAPWERQPDWRLEGPSGPVHLSELFGEREDLLLVFNMGRCSYCAMWADGLNGLLDHLEDRAAFAMVSPLTPQEQAQMARDRGWRFPLVSSRGTTLFEDLGYLDAEGGYLPGVSSFRREADGTIYRVVRGEFEPGDEYCATWHLFDLLPGGSGEWEPRFHYPQKVAQKVTEKVAGCCHG